MLLIKVWLFFLMNSGFYLVSSKCNKSTAAQLEEELRELLEISLNSMTLYDGGDILCSDEKNQSSQNRPSSQEVQEESQVKQVVLKESSVDTNTTDTTSSEKMSYPNTYALVYKDIFDYTKYESSAPSSNITVNVTLEETATVRSDGETSDVLAHDLNSTSSNQEYHSEHSNASLYQEQSGPEHVIPVNILLGEGHGITLLNATSPQHSKFVNLTDVNVYSLDYKFEPFTIVFAGNGTIRSTGLPRVVVATRTEGPVRLAVDWVHDKVYWMSDTHQTVEVAGLDGANRTLITNAVRGIKYPNNIADTLHYYCISRVVEAKFMFFVTNNTIYRSNINRFIFSIIKQRDEHIQSIRCLALDIASNRLYFSGKFQNMPRKLYIASSDYAGGSMKYHDVGDVGWNDVYGMSVFRDSVYFTHYNPPMSDSVWFYNTSWMRKRPVKVYEAPASRGGIWSITVFHPEIQKQNNKLGG